MSLIRIGPPSFSLTRRGYDLWRAPRIIVYLAKVLQGAAIAGVVALGYVYGLHTGRDPLTLIAWTSLFVAIGEKVYGLVSHALGYNGEIAILDWICDITLEMLWLSPLLWRQGHHVAAIAMLVGLAAYPWSEE